MKKNYFLAFIPMAYACLGLLASAYGSVTVSSKTTVLIGANEPLALQKAAADLTADLGKVFGSPVRFVHRRSDAGSTTICISLDENLPPGIVRPTGHEVLQIRTLQKAWKRGSDITDVVILTGSDLRGAIYAVYQFSETYLGVDPLYYWTDRAPARRSTVVLDDKLLVQDGPPSFRYRGWFINDEDLLTGWKPGTADGTGISLAVWDKLFEALLRLKGNMIVPGTFIFPDEPQVKAAKDRGLIVSQHHIEVLGTNTYRWPDDQPYSFTAHPEILEAAWSAAVKQYEPNQEVLWTVGYRGRHDRPFWMDDASAGSTDTEHAQAIQRAIDAQMKIVTPLRQNPHFLFNAWSEAVPLVEKGLLQIPPGVTLVWPDDGFGIIRDGGKISAGEGVYYHTAMYNSMANQLTEMVPLERIQSELGRAAKANATEYLLVNTSDLRPVLMTTRAVMDLAWNAEPWVNNSDQPSIYLNDWCRLEFGALVAPKVAEYYRLYFAAPGRYETTGGGSQTLADNAYHTVTRQILVSLIKGDSGVPPGARVLAKNLIEYASIFEHSSQEAVARWEKARDLERQADMQIPAGSRDLFLSHVKTQLDIQQYSNHMLLQVSMLPTENSPSARLEKIDAAIADAESVLRAMNAAEFGKWAGFYRGDLMVNVRNTLALAKAYRSQLQGKPLPADLPIAVRPVDPYVLIKAYQDGRRVQTNP
jgi:hypothetical protein